MILGVGIDIVEVARINVFLLEERKMQRIFSKSEIGYLEKRKMNTQTAAGLWAAKEAFGKALGTGIFKFSLTDVEIISHENQRPIINLRGKAKVMADAMGASNIHLSISHEKNYAVAEVIIEK